MNNFNSISADNENTIQSIFEERNISLISKLSRRLGELTNPDEVLNLMSSSIHHITKTDLTLFMTAQPSVLNMYIYHSNRIEAWDISKFQEAAIRRFMVFNPDIDCYTIPLNKVERTMVTPATTDESTTMFYDFIPAMLRGEFIGLFGMGLRSEKLFHSECLDFVSIVVNLCIPYYYLG